MLGVAAKLGECPPLPHGIDLSLGLERGGGICHLLGHIRLDAGAL